MLVGYHQGRSKDCFWEGVDFEKNRGYSLEKSTVWDPFLTGFWSFWSIFVICLKYFFFFSFSRFFVCLSFLGRTPCVCPDYHLCVNYHSCVNELNHKNHAAHLYFNFIRHPDSSSLVIWNRYCFYQYFTSAIPSLLLNYIIYPQ